jgi:heme oxygenase
MTLADQLRGSIRETHDSIERTPLAVAMIGGTITRDVYADWLVQMGHLHAGLEAALAGCNEVEAVYSPTEMNRSQLIENDRTVFPTDDAPACEAVASLLEAFAEWRTENPRKLLGALYVLEGSRMGSMALLRPLSKALGVRPGPNCGLSYHLDGIETRPMKWQQFRGVLSGMTLDETEQADVQAAAKRVMDGLHALYAQFTLETVG